MRLCFSVIVPHLYSKSVQASELLKNQYSLPCMYDGSSSQKKVLVCNFAADYNLRSNKMKSNIFIKNENCCVQQEITLAHCRHFRLLTCDRQPISSRRKMSYRERIAQQKCFLSTCQKIVLTSLAT